MEKLFACYRLDQFPNVTLALLEICTFLEPYDDRVIESLANTHTGLQNQCKFPPSKAEIAAFCENSARSYAAIDRKRWAVQHPKPTIAVEPTLDRSNRPTQQLLARPDIAAMIERNKHGGIAGRSQRDRGFRSLREIARDLGGMTEEQIAALPE